MHSSTLVEVKTMYGDRYRVAQHELNGNRTLLRLHDLATGKPLQRETYAQPPVHLHRANICTHDAGAFVTVSALGEHWRECPICRAAVDEQAQRLAACA